MNQHTPAPWQVQEHGGQTMVMARQADQTMRYIVAQLGHWAAYEEVQRANAQLIAAAPDLAKALLDLAEVVNDIATEQCEAGIDVEYWNRTSGEGWRAARAAEAALIKAGVEP